MGRAKRQRKERAARRREKARRAFAQGFYRFIWSAHCTPSFLALAPPSAQRDAELARRQRVGHVGWPCQCCRAHASAP